MNSHVLRAVALAAALLPAFAQAAALTLDQALDLAVQRSAITRSARAGLHSAAESAGAAGQLPDPSLQVGVDNLPVTGSDAFRTTADAMTMKRIGVSQEWRSASKREARRAAAGAIADRERVEVGAAAAETRLQTALAYVDAFYARQALALATLMEHHAHEELEASMARVSSGSGSSQDVLALTSARGIAEDESDDARQQQAQAAVALQRWVGIRPDDLAAPELPPAPGEAAYVDGDPRVAAARRDVEVARRSVAVAESERTADWTWQVSYGQRSGYPDMVSFGVSIPLQVAPAQRQDRETASRRALVDKADADLDEARRTATAQYLALVSDVQRLEQRIERYQSGVLAPAGQRTRVATAGLAANQVSLLALFEARHAEVDARRKLLWLQRDLAKSRARLAYRPLAEGSAQ